MTQCPRPDKEAFDTDGEAQARYLALLHTDPKFAIYRCVCGKWHGGRHVKNRTAHAAAMAPVPTIRTGLNATATATLPAPQRRRRERRATSEVVTLQVHPLVWAQALRTAGGDAGRIEVIDATNVTIHNDSSWRRRG